MPNITRLLVHAGFGLAAAAVVGSALAQDTRAPSAVLDAPATLLPGDALFLYGGRSADAEGRLVRYRWTRVAGPSPAIDPTINQPLETEDPVFSTRRFRDSLPAGLHRFRLQVIDAAGNVSVPATAEVRIVDNVAPVAVLDAPGTIPEGATLVLHGQRSSDVGGRIDRYRWQRLGGSAVETASARFAVPESLGEGRHVFLLTVVDDSGNVSQAARRGVHVLGPDTEPPVAVLSAPGNVGFGRGFELSAAGSKDARGRVVRYRWTHASGAGGSLAPGKPVATSQPTLPITQPAGNPMPPGSHTFRLVVVDDAGNRSRPVQRSVFVAKPSVKRR